MDALGPWSLQPVFGSHLLALVVVAALFALLLMGPSYRQISPGKRWTLAALRAVALLFVAVALLRPTWQSATRKPLTATILILFDESRSMGIAGASGEQSRWQEQLAALQAAAAELEKLSKQFNVRVFRFARQAAPVEMAEDGRIATPEEPTGDETDIGSSLDDAFSAVRGQRLAAAILLSDGAQRASRPRFDTGRAVGQLADANVPLHTVAFGLARDRSQARDVAVTNLDDHYEVAVKNELVVTGAVTISGYANQTIPLELIITDEAGRAEIVDSKVLTPLEEGQTLPFEMSYTPDRPGQYKLTVKAATQPGELVTKNNELTAFLAVRSGGLRVLYIEGELRMEQKFLRRAIDASANIDLDFVYLDRRNRNHWPVDLAEKISDEQYDVIILGDVDSQALASDATQANLDALAEAVAGGKGLLTLGGYHAYGPGGYSRTPLAKVLPVQMDNIRQEFDRPILDSLHREGPLKMLPTSADELMRLADPRDNEDVWRSLRPLTGANAWPGRKPRSRVLAQSEDGAPLLVSGEYGGGRVLAFAGDSTWQWALQSDEGRRLHRRFWRQVIYWLARKVEEQDVWIRIDQRRLAPGGEMTFATGVTTPEGDPATDAELSAAVILPGGERRPITLLPEGDRQSSRFTETSATGDYTVEVRAQREDVEIGVARSKFLVYDIDLELTDPAAQPEHLAQLSRMTAEAGGRRWAAENLPALLRRIRQQPPKMEVEVQQRWQLGDTGADAWLFLIAFVAILSGEWFLRKRWGLV